MGLFRDLWAAFTGQGEGLLLMWGVGIGGILLMLFSNAYVSGLLKASKNMATTKKKKLRSIRKKYENSAVFMCEKGSAQAYVDKNVLAIKWLALPMEFWRRLGRNVCLAIGFIMSGAFLYYDEAWRGSSEMITFLASGVMICVCLLATENILLVNNKLEILKANIQDYLEHIGVHRQARLLRDKELAADCEAAAALSETPDTQESEDEPCVQDEALNSFLQKFFDGQG